jgi:hypothetical protein
MNRNSEQLLSKALRNDCIGEPDKAVEDRLMYAFLLKNSRARVKQNSFSSFAGWLFSGQSFALKTVMVSMVVFFSIFNSQFTFDSGKISASDSISSQRVLVADSAHFIQLVDSLRVDSLN